MLGGLKNIVLFCQQYFFDIIFPKYCLGCGQEGNYLCAKCLAQDRLLWSGKCFCCHKATEELNLCLNCQPLYYFKGVLCAFDYEDKLISEAIRACKYRLAKDLAFVLGDILARYLEQVLSTSTHDFFQDFFTAQIIPLPLSRRRYNWRGFNQAELIAQVVANYFDLALFDGLIRVKHTSAQAKLKEQQRLINLAGSFKVIKPVPAKIILIDDIITTGATANEAAKVLYQAGAEEILVLTLAKG